MNHRSVLFIALAAMLLVAVSAWAHHNMSAIFDFNDRVTLSGTLTKVDWRNPHIELIVDAKSGNQVQTWSFEGPPPGRYAMYSPRLPSSMNTSTAGGAPALLKGGSDPGG